MEENQLMVINTSGLHFRTKEENVLAWRASFTNVLTKYGYVLSESTQSENIHHQLFEKGNTTLAADWFKNGLVEISTPEVDELFESVIPHFEIRVNVRFQCEPVQFELFPCYMVYYLANRSQHEPLETTNEVDRPRNPEIVEVERKKRITLEEPDKCEEMVSKRASKVANRARRKSIAILENAKQKPTGLADLDTYGYAYEIEAERNRRASLTEAARQRKQEIVAEVMKKTSELSASDEYACTISKPPFLVDNIDSPYTRMQGELSDARTLLANTEYKLDSISKRFSRASVNDHYSCQGYQRCCFESFCPLYKHKYKYGYKYGSGIVDSRDYGHREDTTLDQGIDE